MQKPEIPDNELLRMQALHKLAILDTTPEARFDRLTRLASSVFCVPIALVSLVDTQRQWFKSRQGLVACETGRDVSFCAHAILQPGIFEVVDASKDIRFADNPLVTAAPHIRFYAGAPLFSNTGYALGTLCIIDTQPRELNNQQKQALRDLADVVASELNAVEQNQQHFALVAVQHMSSAIARAQEKFIAEGDRRRAFDELLNDILKLTTSEYGFIGEVLYQAGNEPYLKTYAITNIAWNDDTRAFYAANAPQGMEFTNLKTLFGAVLTSGKPVIANTPNHDPRCGGLPAGHPVMHAFLGLPIHHGGKLVAMMGVANRLGGYSQSLIDFLSPLLVTIGQLIVAAQLQLRHAADQQTLMRLSQVASQTTNGVVITDVDGKVQWVNHGFTRITGFTLENMLGRKPGELLQGPDTNQQTVAQMRDALSKHQAFDVNIVNYTPDGSPYWVQIQCNPLHDESGALQGFMAIESDITEIKKSERALIASESRFRGLFELSPVGIALNDYDSGSFVDLNEALLEPTGYSREEFLALSYWQLTPEEYAHQEQLQLDSMEKTGRYGPYEKEYLRKDGSRYPVMLNGMMMFDNSGRKLIWSIVEDISQRKLVDRMKSEFVSTVSHELRTPLTVIMGALELLSVVGAKDLSLPMRNMLDIAYSNSKKLVFLVNDLLDMEKLLAGKMSFILQPLELQPQLAEAIKSNQSYADKFNVTLVLQQANTPLWVNANAERLQQVLANLLSNAAKFSPKGAKVLIFFQQVGDVVRVSVRDRGPGVPDEFKARIFQKFSQADAADNRQNCGTGLGLAITRELMQHMGGIVGFDSAPGEGSTFYIELTRVNTEIRND